MTDQWVQATNVRVARGHQLVLEVQDKTAPQETSALGRLASFPDTLDTPPGWLLPPPGVRVLCPGHTLPVQESTSRATLPLTLLLSQVLLSLNTGPSCMSTGSPVHTTLPFAQHPSLSCLAHSQLCTHGQGDPVQPFLLAA